MKRSVAHLAAAAAIATLPMSASASYTWTFDLNYIANSDFVSTTDLARVTVTAKDPADTGSASIWNFRIENLVGAKVFDFGFNFAGVGEVVASSIFVDKPGPKDVSYTLALGASPAPANVYGPFEYFFTANPTGQAVKSVSFDITSPVIAYGPQSMPFTSLYSPGGKYALYTHVGAFDADTLCVANAAGGQLCDQSFKVVNAGPLPPAEIPEPGTYALLLSGLALLGAMARRRISN
jgi:hypothetical protein